MDIYNEGLFYSLVSNYKQEIADLMIDVFENISIVTYYLQVSFMQNGVLKKGSGSGSQTFVFLKTAEGWKIVHEHGTPDFNTK